MDLPSEGVSQMLSILIKTICGEADVTVTEDVAPIAASRNVNSKPGKRNFSSAAATQFKYLVDIDNGRMKIYVKSLEELKELRRQLLNGTS